MGHLSKVIYSLSFDRFLDIA